MGRRAANVLAIDAVADCRAALTLFGDKARLAVDEIVSDVRRTSMWLRDERLAYWARQLDKRRQQLSDARSALNRARLAEMKRSVETERRAVTRAERALQEAQEKRRIVRKWSQVFESQTQSHLGQVCRVTNFLDRELPQLVARLEVMVRSLEAYAEVTAPTRSETETSETPQDVNDGPGTVSSEPTDPQDAPPSADGAVQP